MQPLIHYPFYIAADEVVVIAVIIGVLALKCTVVGQSADQQHKNPAGNLSQLDELLSINDKALAVAHLANFHCFSHNCLSPFKNINLCYASEEASDKAPRPLSPETD